MMNTRRLRHLPLVALLSLAAACGPVLNGPAASHRTPATSPGTVDSSAASAAPGTDAMLPYPAGATPWTASETGTMDLTRFINSFYLADARSHERALVSARGFVSAERHGWFDADGSQTDLWLVRFRTAAGATSDYDGLTGSWTEHHDGTPFKESALGGSGVVLSKLDKLGNTNVRIAVPVGKVLVYVQHFTPASPDKAATESLIKRQIALLKR